MNGYFISYTVQKPIITNLRKKITIKKFKIFLKMKTCIKLVGMNGHFILYTLQKPIIKNLRKKITIKKLKYF